MRPEQSIHYRVRYWTERRPDAVALTAGDLELTYGQLNARAQRLARELRRWGVGSETPVGLSVPRSPEFVVGALGVLNAGGCYVPIDPGYPELRQALMVSDARLRWMVTAPEAAERWTAAGLRAVSVPTYAPAGAGDGVGSIPVHPASLAYAVYTSGSTGTPKGVAVSHANVIDLIDSDERLGIAPGDVVAQLAPTAFDASVFEIWCALGSGARVAFIARDEMSVASIERDLHAYRPDWLFLTTGLFHTLMERSPAALDKVAHVLTGGEVLSPKHIGAAANRSSGEVYAAYGPTETAVFSSLHRIDREVRYERVPLGTSLASRTMVVLDDELRPVPPGEPGEICIGGGGVVRGYLDKPGATAERFVPDPLSTNPGRRLYRTGDLGRCRQDGVFEFLGRMDRQVKIRGFRVEPGEIEVTLGACDGVDTAVVTVAEVPGGEKRLVAYVVPTPDSAISVADLRTMAGERLPAYAVPSYYVLLDCFPLDPNGKVDRRALPVAWSSRDRLGLPPYQQPRTDTEQTVATVLAESLGVDRVGRDDDFFALGGTSLQSVQVLERLRAIRYQVTSREFFANPTVASLAELLQRRRL